MLGPRVGGDGAALGSRCGETLKLNIWRRKARWPNGSLETLEKLEGGSGSKENAESCFSWGGVHLFNVSLSLSLSICTLLVKESYQIPPIIGCW